MPNEIYDVEAAQALCDAATENWNDSRYGDDEWAYCDAAHQQGYFGSPCPVVGTTEQAENDCRFGVKSRTLLPHANRTIVALREHEQVLEDQVLWLAHYEYECEQLQERWEKEAAKVVALTAALEDEIKWLHRVLESAQSAGQWQHVQVIMKRITKLEAALSGVTESNRASGTRHAGIAQYPPTGSLPDESDAIPDAISGVTADTRELKLLKARAETNHAIEVERDDAMNSVVELEDTVLERDATIREQAARIAALEAKLQSDADSTYCAYVYMCKKTECLGAEEKMHSGSFTMKNLDAHKKTSRLLGQHQGLCGARAALAKPDAAEGESFGKRFFRWVTEKDDADGGGDDDA